MHYADLFEYHFTNQVFTDLTSFFFAQCHIWKPFFRLKVENIIFHDTCLTQFFLTAGFILVSMFFGGFFWGRERFENPRYDWKDFVIYLLENH